MRHARHDRYARVRIVTEVLVPEGHPIHQRERITPRVNAMWSRNAIEQALNKEPETAEYRILSIKRTRMLADGLDQHGDVWVERDDTDSTESHDRDTSTIIPEDQDSVSTGDSDPSDVESEEGSAAAAWEFVVA
ncbi:MAG: hypothetical protein EBS05_11565 [Proteobacteria bacterium]|nr:hypothetical protein [Pseudomonadota bacterium]